MFSSVCTMKLATFLGVVVVVACVTTTEATLDYKRVHLVDKSDDNRNWLFRGNFPSINETTYAYDLLLEYLHSRAKDQGNASLPDHFKLQVITFDNIFNPPLYIEKNFFKENPDKGNLTIWTIVGAVLPPQDVNNATRDALVRNPSVLFSVDQLPSRLETAYKWVHTYDDVPQVIYWHCDAGCDRTGEVSGAYYIRYQGYNITAAYDRDTKECGRQPSYMSTSMLGWYCLYYESTTEKDIGDCLNFSLSAQGNNNISEEE